MSLYTVKPLTSAPHGVWVQLSGQAASPGTRGSRGKVHTAGGQGVVTPQGVAPPPVSQLEPCGKCCQHPGPPWRHPPSSASRKHQRENTKCYPPADMSGSASEMAELLMKEKMKTEEKIVQTCHST